MFEFIFVLSPVFVGDMLPEFMFELDVVVVVFVLLFALRFLFPLSHLKSASRANIRTTASISRMILAPLSYRLKVEACGELKLSARSDSVRWRTNRYSFSVEKL